MPFEELRAALASVVAITVTPFQADAGGRDGDVDVDGYARVVEHCVAGGVRCVTANGNTGEFYALDPDELTVALRTTVDAVGGRAAVLAGVGHDVARAVAMAREAAAAGADAVMVHQPVHPYQSVDGWVEYHRRVAAAVPELGVVCYVRNPLLGGAAFAALADAAPNLVGVKYAVPDPVALPGLVETVGADRLVWVCGLAETWAPYLWVAGARGFTSGLAVVAPRASLELLAALRAGDPGTTMAVWRRLKPFEDLRARAGSAGNVSVVKEALAQLGLCGRGVRPPISELTDDERAQVAAVLPRLGAPVSS